MAGPLIAAVVRTALKTAAKAASEEVAKSAAKKTVATAARKKTAADQAYNVRRRARREAARLEKVAASSTGRVKEVAERRAAKLRRDIAKSYAKGNDKGTRQDAMERLANSVSVTGVRRGTAEKSAAMQVARNRAFRRQLDLALNWKPGSPQSSLAKDPYMAQAMAKAFMHAHTDIRRYANDIGRRDRIFGLVMEAHDTTDLYTAYLETMRENRAEIQRMYKVMNSVGDDGDAKYESIKPMLARLHQQPRYMA